jgi:hypothetical protein
METASGCFSDFGVRASICVPCAVAAGGSSFLAHPSHPLCRRSAVFVKTLAEADAALTESGESACAPTETNALLYRPADDLFDFARRSLRRPSSRSCSSFLRRRRRYETSPKSRLRPRMRGLSRHVAVSQVSPRASTNHQVGQPARTREPANRRDIGAAAQFVNRAWKDRRRRFGVGPERPSSHRSGPLRRVSGPPPARRRRLRSLRSALELTRQSIETARERCSEREVRRFVFLSQLLPLLRPPLLIRSTRSVVALQSPSCFVVQSSSKRPSKLSTAPVTSRAR